MPDSRMVQQLLETYRCLISCRKNMPGMRLEDAFEDIGCIEQEYKWLQKHAVTMGIAEDATFISGKS